MSSYEYTVIPAPARAEKSKGARSGIDRFAATLTDTLNEMARDGWDYVRAEVLPAEERSGLTSRNTVYHNLLVFRRALDAAPTRALPVQDIAHTAPPAAEPIRPPEPPTAQPAPSQPAPAPSQPAPAPSPAAQVRAPFSQPMRAMPKQQPQARVPEPPLTAPPQPALPQGPRLGPATR